MTFGFSCVTINSQENKEKPVSYRKAELQMKSTGIVRNIDELGRVVVPKEIRKKLGISNTDPVEIYVEGDKIILTKYLPVCHFCGSTDGLIEYKDKNICSACVAELARK